MTYFAKGGIAVMVILALISMGCVTLGVDTSVEADGSYTCKANYSSMGKNIAGFEASACDDLKGKAETSTDSGLSDALLNTLIRGMVRP